MGALTVVYVLTGISRPPSVAFTLLHASHGFACLLVMAPGLFLASVVYGHLAQKSGSILPGMALHFAGDLAFSYFGLLGGDSARLFVDLVAGR